jgi:hypothetical protein
MGERDLETHATTLNAHVGEAGARKMPLGFDTPTIGQGDDGTSDGNMLEFTDNPLALARGVALNPELGTVAQGAQRFVGDVEMITKSRGGGEVAETRKDDYGVGDFR